MKNQKQFIINELNKNGYISRNYCLQNYISRLGAYICDLNKEGWQINGQNEGNDFIYRISHKNTENAPTSQISTNNPPLKASQLFNTSYLYRN